MGIDKVQQSTGTQSTTSNAGKSTSVTIPKNTEVFPTKKDTVYVNRVVIEFGSPKTLQKWKNAKDDAWDISVNMNKAIEGLGTDDELLHKTINSIQAENIFEVNEGWNDTFGLIYKETFIESLLDDADSGQRRIFGFLLMQKLEQRTKIEGANSKTTEGLARYFRQELGKRNPDDDVLINTFNQYINQLKGNKKHQMFDNYLQELRKQK